MIALRRIYLYTVLAVLLVPLLVGMGDLLKVLFDGLAEVSGQRPAAGNATREDLSLALALLIVATPLWGLHAWLLARSTRGDPGATQDERASGVRSSYFLVVLLVTLIIAALALVAWIDIALRSNTLDGPFDASTAFAYALSFGVAWALHAGFRMRDLRLAPERTAGDWLTRVDLYGVLSVAGVVALVSFSDLITTVARFLIEGRPIAGSSGWLRDAVASPLAATLVAAVIWSVHWFGGRRLCLSPAPLGPAHRGSRMRLAYLIAIAFVSSAAVLMLIGDSLRQVVLDVAAVRAQIADPNRLAIIGGPLLASAPFLVAWWWHLRRAAYEGSVLGGDALHATVTRIGRFAVAIVGLTGLALGSALSIGALLDLGSTYVDDGVVSAPIIRRDLAGALSMAIVGLAIWLPAWILVQRERARSDAVASSMARRSYLILVSGAAVVVAMISGAWVVYQAIGALLGTGGSEAVPQAIGFLGVAVVGLGYHLLVLRADVRVAPAVAAADILGPLAPKAGTGRLAGLSVEEVIISGPVGADFRPVNEHLREHLPVGFELRVVETHRA